MSATGIPVASANSSRAASAAEYATPPPATSNGRWALRSTSVARASATASGCARGTCQVRPAKSSSGQSKASAWTSWGSAIVTAPVSAGSVSVRIAPSIACGNCSGRSTRAKNFDTGRKASLTLVPGSPGSSSSCSSAPAARVAKTSPGSSSTGNRLMVARAAPVTMFVAPGPIEVVQASVCNRSRIRAYPQAAWTIACSFRAR